MPATIIDGRKIATEIQQQVTATLTTAIAAGSRPPKLAAILVGDDPASQIYVHHKQKVCQKVGIETTLELLPQQASFKQLQQSIETFNQDPGIDGILLQLPLPSHLNALEAVSLLSPDKDVDGLSPFNQGYLFWKKTRIIPCTAEAVIHIVTGVTDIKGKTCAVIGLSPLAGLPICLRLTQLGATVICIHKHTKEPQRLVSSSDCVISATGVKHLIHADWVKDNAVVIDVGIVREDKKLFGDVHFESVVEKASYLTPVPFGVGPVTIAMLTQNTLKLYQRRLQDEQENQRIR